MSWGPIDKDLSKFETLMVIIATGGAYGLFILADKLKARKNNRN